MLNKKKVTREDPMLGFILALAEAMDTMDMEQRKERNSTPAKKEEPKKKTPSVKQEKPFVPRHMFKGLMGNLLEHIKFDEVLYRTTSGMMDIRNNHYYETDMLYALVILVNDKKGRINNFVTKEKERLAKGGNISDHSKVGLLFDQIWEDNHPELAESAT